MTVRSGTSVGLRAADRGWENWVVTVGAVTILQDDLVHDLKSSGSFAPVRDRMLSLHNHSPADAIITIVRHDDEIAGTHRRTAADLLNIMSDDETETNADFTPLSVTMNREDENHHTN